MLNYIVVVYIVYKIKYCLKYIQSSRVKRVGANLVLERFSIKFTSNGKREFLPRDQVSPLIVVYCTLFLPLN